VRAIPSWPRRSVADKQQLLELLGDLLADERPLLKVIGTQRAVRVLQISGQHVLDLVIASSDVIANSSSGTSGAL